MRATLDWPDSPVGFWVWRPPGGCGGCTWKLPPSLSLRGGLSPSICPICPFQVLKLKNPMVEGESAKCKYVHHDPQPPSISLPIPKNKMHCALGKTELGTLRSAVAALRFRNGRSRKTIGDIITTSVLGSTIASTTTPFNISCVRGICSYPKTPSHPALHHRLQRAISLTSTLNPSIWKERQQRCPSKEMASPKRPV